MTEILTESFCERCGTRYTFESARPKTRLKGVKVLSRGLKNFVLSDDTSMDEAMAAARSETDREQTSHQLDAFHKTFNFCMSCRQYTCPNCWNEVEARCLSCAPHLGHEVLPAAFADLPSGPLVADAALYGADPAVTNGTSPAHGTNGTNGADHGTELIGMAEVQARRDEEVDAAARLAALTAPPAPAAEPDPIAAIPEPEILEAPAASAAPATEPPVQPAAPTMPAPATPAPPPVAPGGGASPYDDVDASTPTWLKALVVGSQADGAPADEAPTPPAPIAPTASEPAAAVVPAEPEPIAPSRPEPVAAAAPAPVDVAPEPEPIETVDEPDTIAAIDDKAAAQTAGLLQRFRPAAEIEPDIEAAAAVAASAAIVDAPDAPVAEAAPPAPEPIAPVAATAAPLPAPAMPESIAAPAPPVVEAAPAQPAPAAPVPLVEPAPAQPAPAAPATPELAAAATATPAAPAEDVVRQPVWQMVAPDDAAAPADGAAPGRPEPQWPTRPEWPDPTPAAGLPFLNRPATPTGGIDALWAESTREVVATPSKNGRPANVVQPCVSCGLSLSATARFCRRCGSPQGS